MNSADDKNALLDLWQFVNDRMSGATKAICVSLDETREHIEHFSRHFEAGEIGADVHFWPTGRWSIYTSTMLGEDRIVWPRLTFQSGENRDLTILSFGLPRIASELFYDHFRLWGFSLQEAPEELWNAWNDRVLHFSREFARGSEKRNP